MFYTSANAFLSLNFDNILYVLVHRSTTSRYFQNLLLTASDMRVIL